MERIVFADLGFCIVDCPRPLQGQRGSVGLLNAGAVLGITRLSSARGSIADREDEFADRIDYTYSSQVLGSSVQKCVDL